MDRIGLTDDLAEPTRFGVLAAEVADFGGEAARLGNVSQNLSESFDVYRLRQVVGDTAA